MHLIAQLARQLAESGHGTWPEAGRQGDVFYGMMPPKPDACLCVYAVDASVPGSENGARVQIVLRGPPGVTDPPLTLGMAVAEELDGWKGFLCGDGHYVKIAVENGPADIGPDENSRQMYSVNLRVRYC